MVRQPYAAEVRDDDHEVRHFVWKRLSGNFILSTWARFVGTGVEAHRKMGWTVRATLEADAPHVTAAVHGDSLASLQFRRSPGAMTEEGQSPVRMDSKRLAFVSNSKM